ILGAIAGLAFLVIPSIEKQINDFSVEIPNYAQQFGDKIQFLVKNSFLESYYNEAYQWVTSNLSNLPDIISNKILKRNFLESYYNEAYQWVTSNLSNLPDIISKLLRFDVTH